MQKLEIAKEHIISKQITMHTYMEKIDFKNIF
jgi:hypothetical protein